MEYTGYYKGHSKQIPIMRLTYVNAIVQILDENTTSTENGTSTKSGICTSTKIGTGTSTVFGTLNLKEETKILTNNKGTSDEVPFCDKKMEISKSDYKVNHREEEKNTDNPLDKSEFIIRSDYQKNQSEKSSIRSKKVIFGVDFILQTNLFQIPEAMIRDWIYNRNKKKAPVTKTAWDKINKELTVCKEQGIDPIEAFETMVASGWQSLKSEYFQNQKKSSAPEYNDRSNDTSWIKDLNSEIF